MSCRGPAALRRLLESRLVDAVVLSPQPGAAPGARRAARPAARRSGRGVRAVPPGRRRAAPRLPQARGGVGRGRGSGRSRSWATWSLRVSLTAERRRALADAPRMLRLTEPLQRAAWNLLLGRRGAPDPHHRPGSAAPGEPGASLPPVRRRWRAESQAGDRPDPDRLRRPAAGQSGLPIPTVVRLLHFASSSHLSGTRAPDRERAHQRTRRAGPARGAGGVREGEYAEQGVGGGSGGTALRRT